jgi:hypothetical protein
MRRLRKWSLIGVAVGAFALFICYFVFPGAHRITVQNASGVPVKNVVLTISRRDGTVFLQRKTAELMPNETLVARHFKNDTQAAVSFEIDGRRFEPEGEVIDLWTGEGWKFEIQRYGGVASGHEQRD